MKEEKSGDGHEGGCLASSCLHSILLLALCVYLRHLDGGAGVVERDEVLGQPPVRLLVWGVQDLVVWWVLY